MQRCQCARLTGWTTRPLKSAVLHDDTDSLTPCAVFMASCRYLHDSVCQACAGPSLSELPSSSLGVHTGSGQPTVSTGPL